MLSDTNEPQAPSDDSSGGDVANNGDPGKFGSKFGKKSREDIDETRESDKPPENKGSREE